MITAYKLEMEYKNVNKFYMSQINRRISRNNNGKSNTSYVNDDILFTLYLQWMFH